MAKAETASPDIERIVQEVARELGLTQIGIEIKVLAKKSKEVVKLKKADEVAEIALKKDKLFGLYVYEEAFDKVDEKEQWMWVRQALSRISYDFEKDKVTTSVPMVSIPLELYQKYGKIAIDNAILGIMTVQGLEMEEKERKAFEKSLKKKRK